MECRGFYTELREDCETGCTAACLMSGAGSTTTFRASIDLFHVHAFFETAPFQYAPREGMLYIPPHAMPPLPVMNEESDRQSSKITLIKNEECLIIVCVVSVVSLHSPCAQKTCCCLALSRLASVAQFRCNLKLPTHSYDALCTCHILCLSDCPFC